MQRILGLFAIVLLVILSTYNLVGSEGIEAQQNRQPDPFIDEVIEPFIDSQKWGLALQRLLVEVEKDPNYADGWFYLSKIIVLEILNRLEEFETDTKKATERMMRMDYPCLLKQSLDKYLRLDPYGKICGHLKDASRLQKVVSSVVKREYNPDLQNELKVEDLGQLLEELAGLIEGLDKFDFLGKPLPYKKTDPIAGISEKYQLLSDIEVVLAAIMWLKKDGVEDFTLRQLCNKIYEKYGRGQFFFSLYYAVMQMKEMGVLLLNDKNWSFEIDEKHFKEIAPAISKLMNIPWP